MTEAEVRQMQEKAANQWMQEDRRGDRRGGAKEERLVFMLDVNFMFRVLMLQVPLYICTTLPLHLYISSYLEAEGGRAGRPGRGGQRQPGGGQTFLQ